VSFKPWVSAPPAAELPAQPRQLVLQRPRRKVRALGELDPVGRASFSLTTGDKVMLGVHGLILLSVAYHGYRRNEDSVPWALSWALGGFLCPTVTLAFALTQGFAKPER
jgi:hypothetical protein